ncbi:putative spermidine/putrescine transport system substrate-binding protein [Rhizobium aethiopicum]|uniref:extracellular solute-binding protein n=1 Tax=Rhizobium aethiopicum TaxID=1138170 RepID=UPI001610707A|nr:extracellular solute-binding protein [Rhizobium aethiopicum]MBB4581600.1 putative spermidine/putrescine transport system substrate-binding protein [Rhizobium aethiopicum]
MLRKIAAATAALILTAGISQARDLSSKSWDDIVAQAKQEGEINFFVWYLQDDLRNAVKPFEEKYGIRVNIPDGDESANRDKLLAERGRDVGDIDVMALGYSRVLSVPLADLFVKVKDLLPDTDTRAFDLAGAPSEGYLAAFWGNQTGIAYDPTKVDEANLPQTPEDLAAFWSAHPGKFGFNYQDGSSGISFYYSVLRAASGMSDKDFFSGESSKEKLAALQPGIDFFNKHANNYVVTASNADSITRLSDGELWIAAGFEDHLAGLQSRGEARKELKLYVPKMGMAGGGNGVGIPVNARNKAAALVFVEWLTSAETQSWLNEHFGTAPMNAKADSSKALVSADQRARQVAWPLQPFRKNVDSYFVEHVIQER